MTKNTRKSTVNHGKPITDFFTRATRIPASSQNRSTSPAGKRANQTNTEQDISPNNTNPKPLTPKKIDLQVRRSLRIDKNVTPFSSGPSRKRSRSTEAQPSTWLKPQSHSRIITTRKSPERRKASFDSDSDMEVNNEVVYVKTSPNPRTSKKIRLSSPHKLHHPISTEVIPSSQSDEEAPIPHINSPIPTVAIHEAQLSPSMPQWQNPVTRSMASSPERAATPPSSDLPSMPPTPIALNEASKTAKIIAEIKERAYAKSLSSPEPSLIDIGDTLDSSSDEEELPLSIFDKKQKASIPRAEPSSGSTKRAIRYSLRNRSSPTNTLPTEASSSKPPKLSLPLRPKKPSKVVPFEALLREKRMAEKYGNGRDVFEVAEAAVNRIDDDHFFLDDFDQGSILLGWDTISKAASDTQRFFENSKRTTASSNQDSEDQKHLSSDNIGTSILKILHRDKKTQEQEASPLRIPGLRFWSKEGLSTNHTTDVDITESLLRFPGSSPVIRHLNTCVGQDVSHANMLLDADIMSVIAPSERAAFASALCDIVLSSRVHPLAESSLRTLEGFWSTNDHPIESTISFPQILDSLLQLNCETSFFLRTWPSEKPSTASLDSSNVKIVVDRIVSLIAACACSKRLKQEELPDIVVALILLAMDFEVSEDLLRDITEAVDLCCICIASRASQTTFDICLKTLECTTPLSPVNRFRVVSIFAEGSTTTRVIGNIIAYCLTTGKQLDKELVTETLPLSDIIDEINGGINFAIFDDTDYIDLGLHVMTLAVPVADVKGYVKGTGKVVRMTGSPSKNPKEPTSELLLLHSALENLHSAIRDNPTDGLDRQKTKAIIKGLSLSIHYQNLLWSGSDAKRKLTTIDSFFKPSKS